MHFIYITLISILFLYLTFKFSKRFKFYDLPDGEKIHEIKIPNLGGLALIPFTFSTLYFFDYNQSNRAETDESLLIRLIASPIKGAMLICLIFFVFFTIFVG